MDLLQNFYETTLDALKDAKNDRLWFKTNTKLGKLYFDLADYNKLTKILKQLHASCQVRYIYCFKFCKFLVFMFDCFLVCCLLTILRYSVVY